LISCTQIRADKKIRAVATKRNDSAILAVAANELIAKEACYHRSCYREYTREYTRSAREGNDSGDVSELPKVYKFLSNLYDNPRVVELKEIQEIVTSQSEKKNLKRKIENETTRFKFVSVNKTVLVYPTSLKMEDLVIANHQANSRLKGIERMNATEKVVLKCANIIKDEIRNIKYKMPWPPSPQDLEMSSFTNSKHLDSFLGTLLISDRTGKTTDGVRRLKQSFGQDLTYAGIYVFILLRVYYLA